MTKFLIYRGSKDFDDKIKDNLLEKKVESMSEKILQSGIPSSRIRVDSDVVAIEFGECQYFLVDQYRCTIPDVTVLCFFDYYDQKRARIKARGGRLENLFKQEFTRIKRRQTVSDDDLERFAAETISQEGQKPQPDSREPLPERYHGWMTPPDIQSPIQKSVLNMTVEETKEWRDHISRAGDKNLLGSVYEKLQKFWDHSTQPEKIGIGDDGITQCLDDKHEYYYFTVKPNMLVLCRLYSSSVKDKGENVDVTILTLVDIATTTDDVEGQVNAIIGKYEESGKNKRKAKCYPGILLDSSTTQSNNASLYEKWLKLETEADYNAGWDFSRQERDLIFEMTSRAGCLPVFINGNAGSGKSTVLYYIFSDYWLKMLKAHEGQVGANEYSGKPLFLTLSDELNKKARAVVAQILMLDPEVKDTEEKIDNDLKSSFFHFERLLRVIIGDNNEMDYPPGRKMDFELFKDLLEGNRDANGIRVVSVANAKYCFSKGKLRGRFSAELCWHIIRSYIKGYGVVGNGTNGSRGTSYLSPDKFPEDPFVSLEDFEYVYKQVWPWYKELTCGIGCPFWDQQDLARAALKVLDEAELPEGMRDFTAIFCDEAQDLTGIELQFVQHLSCLLKYGVARRTDLVIPFAFAGDPMQTLNPSGFRWEDLSSAVYRNILSLIGGERELEELGLDLKERSLTLNYRSPRSIVQLANLIQLMRRALFGDKVDPQAPDKEEPGRLVYHIIGDDEAITEPEILSLSESTIILPCSEGREQDFIKQYQILQDIDRMSEGRQRFLSVLTAKGLDISRVVVFGFGDQLFNDQLSDDFCNQRKNIALSYALNKVYVALTRVSDQLIIVDTKAGDDNFWKPLTSPGMRMKLLASVADQGKDGEWKDNLPDDRFELEIDPVRSSIMFEAEAMTDDQKKSEVESMFAMGRNRESHLLMYNAAMSFERLARTAKDKKELWEKKILCDAFSSKYRRDWKAAAEKFLSRELLLPSYRIGSSNIEPSKEAGECLWIDEAWEEFRKYQEQGRIVTVDESQQAVIEIMQASQLTMDNQLKRFLDRDKDLRKPRRGLQWKHCLEKLSRYVLDERSDLNSYASPDLLSDPDKCQLLEEFGDYLLEASVLFPEECLKAALRIKTRIAMCRDDRKLWEEAYDVLQNCFTEIDSRDKNLILAHNLEWPDYVPYCQMEGEAELCYARWNEYCMEHSEIEARKMSVLSQKDATYFFQVLAKNKDPKTVDLAIDAGCVPPVLSYEMTFDQGLKCIDVLLRKPSSQWSFFSALFSRVISMCKKAEDVNAALWRVLSAIDSDLPRFKNQSADAVARPIMERLLDRSVSSVWPANARDFKLAATIFAKIGLRNFITTFSRSYITSPNFRGRRDICEEAIKLFMYATYDNWNHLKGETQVECEKDARIFINTTPCNKGENGDAIFSFDDYWRQLRNGHGRYDVEELRQNVDTMKVGGTDDRPSVDDQGEKWDVCIVGARYNVSSQHATLGGMRYAPLFFKETRLDITITNAETGDEAVIHKPDWNNQSCELQNLGLHNGVEYKVHSRGISIKLPEWTDSVEMIFK